MARTSWTGPLAVGDKPAGASGGPNVGFVVLSQSKTINFDNTLVQNATFKLPRGSQILQIIEDVTVAYNSATSATLTVGTAPAGTQYASGTDVKTVGRKSLTPTAAQLSAAADIGGNTDVVATVTSVGQPTAGQVVVTLLYVQKSSDD
jgi:predicted metalloendopeptidase